MIARATATSVAVAYLLYAPVWAQRYSGADGKLRVALAQQPFSPNGTSPGPKTMATGGIQQQLARNHPSTSSGQAPAVSLSNRAFVAIVAAVPSSRTVH